MAESHIVVSGIFYAPTFDDAAFGEAPAPAPGAVPEAFPATPGSRGDLRRAQTPQRPCLSPAAPLASAALFADDGAAIGCATVEALGEAGVAALLGRMGLGHYESALAGVDGRALLALDRAALRGRGFDDADALYLCGALYLWMDLRF